MGDDGVAQFLEITDGVLGSVLGLLFKRYVTTRSLSEEMTVIGTGNLVS